MSQGVGISTGGKRSCRAGWVCGLVTAQKRGPNVQSSGEKEGGVLARSGRPKETGYPPGSARRETANSGVLLGQTIDGLLTRPPVMPRRATQAGTSVQVPSAWTTTKARPADTGIRPVNVPISLIAMSVESLVITWTTKLLSPSCVAAKMPPCPL